MSKSYMQFHTFFLSLLLTVGPIWASESEQSKKTKAEAAIEEVPEEKTETPEVKVEEESPPPKQVVPKKDFKLNQKKIDELRRQTKLRPSGPDALPENIPSVERQTEGGSCGGGGTILRFKGQKRPVLLDSVSFQPETFNSSYFQDSPVLVRPSGQTLPLLAALLPEDEVVRQLATQRLEQWTLNQFGKQNSIVALAQTLLQTLKDTTFTRSRLSFKVLPRYFLPPVVDARDAEIQTAILYLQNYGAILSTEVWDAQDVETQVGLLIHESFRAVQTTYQFHDLSDRELQFMTAALMNLDPKQGFDLFGLISKESRLGKYILVKSLAYEAQPNGEAMAALMALNWNEELNATFSRRQQIRVQHLLSSPEGIEAFVKELRAKDILQ